MYYELTDHFSVPASPEATWEFFSRAENLPAITPPSMKFTITTPPPVTIAADAILDYTIAWMNIPIRWRTRIIDWSPPHQFIDLQLRGPYALWHHQHTFTPIDGGTECRDRVIYKIPASVVGRAVHRLMIRRQLLTIFNFRREAIAKRLSGLTPLQPAVQIERLG